MLFRSGGRMRVELGHPSDNTPLFSGASSSNDNIILRLTLRLQKEHKEDPVIFVSRDVNMRLKADALGILVEDYEHGQLASEESYTGVTERVVSAEVVSEAYAKGFIEDEGTDLSPHQFVVLKNESQANHTAMTRFDSRLKQLRLVARHKEGCWGIFSRNREQLFAMDLLMDESISLVTLDGMAGTGKTLLAMA